MRAVGWVVTTILVLAVFAFVGIGIYSEIALGDFFEQYRIWFDIGKSVKSTVTPETSETAAVVFRMPLRAITKLAV